MEFLTAGINAQIDRPFPWAPGGRFLNEFVLGCFWPLEECRERGHFVSPPGGRNFLVGLFLEWFCYFVCFLGFVFVSLMLFFSVSTWACASLDVV